MQTKNAFLGKLRRISDPANELLDSLINRLPPNDRPRFRTYCHQLLAATTTLGVARVIRACLPLRCDSSNRVLPTPGDAIPSNGLPPRPPPGQYRPQLPSHHTTPLSPRRAVRPSDFTESPSTSTTTMSPSDRSVATAADRPCAEIGVKIEMYSATSLNLGHPGTPPQQQRKQPAY